MNFIPYENNIVVLPLKSDSVFDEGKLQEVGMVLAIGSKVKGIKVGDTVFFNAEGIRKTQKISGEGIEYYCILTCPEFILGTIKNETSKKPTVAK